MFLLHICVLRPIIVNLHKKSRVFLYSFNTLRFSKRYCILFLYQYNRDNKREKRAGRKKKDNTDKGSDPAKEKRAARRI